MKKIKWGLILFIISLMFSGCNDSSGEEDLSLFPQPGEAGYKETFSTDGVSFKMVYCPGGTFPTGVNDDGGDKTVSAFWIGETEVTYGLWSKVYIWASGDADMDGSINGAEIEGDYIFANKGEGHSSNHALSSINWRDAMVFCNAVTEWYNLNAGTDYSCVYYTDYKYTKPVRTATNSTEIEKNTPGSQDNPFIKASVNSNTSMSECIADGFRLDTIGERECAARYIDGSLWTYGDHVSGDESGACYDDGEILGGLEMSSVYGDYAWYWENKGSGCHVVGTAGNEGGAPLSGLSNALGCYDMCGNSDEWGFDWNVLHPEQRALWGGSFYSSSSSLRIGYNINSNLPNITYTPGLRLCRSSD